MTELIRDGARAIGQAGAYVGQQVAGEATALTRRLGDESARVLDRQKGAAAREIGQVGAAIRQAAGGLRGEHVQGLTPYVEAAAQQVDKVSDYLDRRDLAGLARDAEHLARRQPAWFVGGMLLTGVVIGRFMKAALESGQTRSARFRSAAAAAAEPESPRRREEGGAGRKRRRRGRAE